MSFTTFHKIKQLTNGDFVVTTKCSNDSAPPHEWVMDYFTKEYPNFNNRQLEATLILCGLYSGDKYYPVKFKRLQDLAHGYAKIHFEERGDYPYPLMKPCSREVFERETNRIKDAEKSGAYVPDYWKRFKHIKDYEDYFTAAS